MSHGYRNLTLSPNANASLGAADGIVLDDMAAKLGAKVAAGGLTHGWTIHATAGTLREAMFGAKGSIAVAIYVALENLGKQRDMVDEDLADLGAAVSA